MARGIKKFHIESRAPSAAKNKAKKPRRKVIQIASSGDDSALYALCDDGSMWTWDPVSSEWIGFAGIPQRP
jgi:hypothetical protein